MIIAIDGPAGAGKSTVAQRVSAALGLTFLDTGAMYRAVTLAVLERGVHPSDARACTAVACELNLGFDREGRILIDGAVGEPDIRSSTVTLNVSAVSAHQGVREAVVDRQREIAKRSPGIVAEGRDTTTVVFPEADHKFFLNASADERARRRALQDGTIERLAEVRDDIERRDRLDTTRAHSPLKQAPDAIAVEADGLAVHEVVERILKSIKGEASR